MEVSCNIVIQCLKEHSKLKYLNSIDLGTQRYTQNETASKQVIRNSKIMLHARTQVHQTYVFVLIQFQHHSILTQKHEEKKIFNFNFLIVKNSRKRRRNTKNINNG